MPTNTTVVPWGTPVQAPEYQSSATLLRIEQLLADMHNELQLARLDRDQLRHESQAPIEKPSETGGPFAPFEALVTEVSPAETPFSKSMKPKKPLGLKSTKVMYAAPSLKPTAPRREAHDGR